MLQTAEGLILAVGRGHQAPAWCILMTYKRRRKVWRAVAQGFKMSCERLLGELGWFNCQTWLKECADIHLGVGSDR